MIGSQMAGFTILGVLIDWAAGSVPWATCLGTLFGFVAAFIQLIRSVQSPQNPDGTSSPSDREGGPG